MNKNTQYLLSKREALIDQLNQMMNRIEGKKFYSVEAAKEAIEPIMNLATDIIDFDTRIIVAVCKQIPQQD